VASRPRRRWGGAIRTDDLGCAVSSDGPRRTCGLTREQLASSGTRCGERGSVAQRSGAMPRARVVRHVSRRRFSPHARATPARTTASTRRASAGVGKRGSPVASIPTARGRSGYTQPKGHHTPIQTESGSSSATTSPPPGDFGCERRRAPQPPRLLPSLQRTLHDSIGRLIAADGHCTSPPARISAGARRQLRGTGWAPSDGGWEVEPSSPSSQPAVRGASRSGSAGAGRKPPEPDERHLWRSRHRSRGPGLLSPRAYVISGMISRATSWPH